MYIIRVMYKKPLEEVDRYLADHRAFLDRHFEAGHLIASGPQIPRQGGVIMIRDMEAGEMQAILDQDPFRVNDIAEYYVTEFVPTKFCDPALETLITKL